jgi:hypothetical protein
MWPHLKRRARPDSPSRPASWNASSAGHGIDVDADDKAFAAALSRTGSTKDEFMARSSLANAFRTGPNMPPSPSQDVSVWAKLESSAKLLRKPGRRGDAAAAPAGDKRQAKSLTRSDAKNMLTIRGLSTNLSPSDFSRLDPGGLAQWGSAFKKGNTPLFPPSADVRPVYDADHGPPRK